ncbi:MAG: hypothetical protein ACI4YA_00270 [Candidatus Spyradenecus sp.]
MVKIEKRKSLTFAGVTVLAARLGVTKSHVSRVLHGERRSTRVEAAARKMGWRPLTDEETSR